MRDITSEFKHEGNLGLHNMCDRIANSVSHNFKVPLNILKESISILKKKMETNFPDANHSMIQDIKNYTIKDFYSFFLLPDPEFCYIKFYIPNLEPK